MYIDNIILMAKKAKKVIIVPQQKPKERDRIQLTIKDPKKEDIKPKDIFQGYTSKISKTSKKKK